MLASKHSSNGILKYSKFLVFAAFLTSCAGTKKNQPELSAMEGRKVALISVDAEPTMRRMVEVALVNQLVKLGTFVLIPKSDVDKARALHHIDPRNEKKIGEAVDADYTMTVRVLELRADELKGYSQETIQDSQLAEERGDDGKTERVYPVKALDGKVQIEVTFLEIKNGDLRKGLAEASRRVEKEGNKEAIHLPPRMRFLEELTGEAFHQFFERYN